MKVKLSILPTKFYFYLCSSVCHLLRSGVAALFGPQSGTTSSHVQSICDAMEIPHIETRWDYRLKRDDYSVNLYPHPTAISKVKTKKNINSFCQYFSNYTIFWKDSFYTYQLPLKLIPRLKTYLRHR